MPITYTKSAEGVNWPQLRDDLEKDHFHNGRTAEELARSFTNSSAVAFAWAEGRVMARRGRCRMGSAMPMWWMSGPTVPIGVGG